MARSPDKNNKKNSPANKKGSSNKKKKPRIASRQISTTLDSFLYNIKKNDSAVQEKPKDEIDELLTTPKRSRIQSSQFSLCSPLDLNSQTIKTELIDINNVEHFDPIPMEHNSDPFFHFNESDANESFLSITATQSILNESKVKELFAELPNDPLFINDVLNDVSNVNVHDKQNNQSTSMEDQNPENANNRSNPYNTRRSSPKNYAEDSCTQNINKNDVKFKVSRFTMKEDDIIRTNWNVFCNTHKWDPENTEPFMNLRKTEEDSENRKIKLEQFRRCMKKKLEDRSWELVHERFKYLYRPDDTKANQFNDQQILKYLSTLRSEAQKKQILLNQESVDKLSTCLTGVDKTIIKTEVCTDNVNEVSIEWTPRITCKFIKTLMKVTLCERISDLKYAVIPDVVWNKMRERMNIKKNVLEHFWNHWLHMQLFCDETISLNEIKIRLIQYMYLHKISDYNKIQWRHVRSTMNGMTIEFLENIFLSLLNKGRKLVKRTNINTIVNYLHAKEIPALQQLEKDKTMPRITNLEEFMKKYSNGTNDK